MASPTKNRGISHGISFSTTKITLKIPTFLRYGIVEEGILICVIVQTKGTVLLVCICQRHTKSYYVCSGNVVWGWRWR